MREADATALARDHLADLTPDDFPSLRLIPASALVELGSNADDLWSAVEDGLPPPSAESTSRAVMVWRRSSFAVVHRTVDADEVACVRLLATGAEFSTLCEALAEAQDPAARAIELLLRWTDSEMLERCPISAR